MSKKDDLPESKIINDEVKIGVMADGLEVTVTPDYFVLDAGIWKPRSSEQIIVSRIVVPISALEPFINGLQEALELYQSGKLETRIIQGTREIDVNE